MLREGQRLREDVSQPIACRYADTSHLTVLNHFVSEVLADVHVLASGALASADGTVSSFDARRVVFVDRVIKFLLHSNRQLAENRHVMCVVEKAGFEPKTLGIGAERATNCATAPVTML